MGRLLACDPGARHAGLALFEDGFLVAAALARPSSLRRGRRTPSPPEASAAVARAAFEWALGRGVSEIALEWPRVYATSIRRGLSKEDPNDLLPLAGTDAALAALLGGVPCAAYAPSDWKGQMPHEVLEARVRGRLRPAELHVLDEAASAAGALGHNVVDAVGVGLHHAGRFRRRRAGTGEVR